MAKNSKPAGKAGKGTGKKVSSTPVRNTAIPKAAAPTKSAPASKPPAPVIKSVTPTPTATKTTASATAKPTAKVVTHDDIAKRAFEIHMSGTGGSETDNWHRAERELRGK